MNSCNTDIFFSNYYDLQSVRFEFIFKRECRETSLLLKFGFISVKLTNRFHVRGIESLWPHLI